MSEPKYRNEEWLREQYVQKERTTYKIAKECGCSATTVGDWLKRHNIETRKGSPGVPDKRLSDEAWLREQYVKKECTIRAISETCGCSTGTVWRWIKRHGIETRRGVGAPIPDKRLKNEEWLREQYVKKERTTSKIAKECGCAPNTIWRWIKRHGIDVRQITAQNNPNWNGGVFPYGSGWNETKRREVRERDGHECVDCGTTQDEHKAEHGEKLHVHHLIKARDIDDPEERNAVENLVTLCRDCHRNWERVSEAGIKPQLEAI